jgi:hypothetical protein
MIVNLDPRFSATLPASCASSASVVDVFIKTDATAGKKVYVCAAGAWEAQGGSGGITNSAGANVLMKSNGTNAVASLATDDGTTFSYGGSGGIATNGAAAGEVSLVEASPTPTPEAGHDLLRRCCIKGHGGGRRTGSQHLA